MKREYISEIRYFNEYLDNNSLSTGQIALWYALMYINNKCFWAEWFSAANKSLTSKTGMTKQGMYKARDELKRKGLIDFKNATSSTAYYKIIDFELFYKNSYKIVQEKLQNSSEIVKKKLQNSCPLIDKDKRHKTKDKDIPPVVPQSREEEKPVKVPFAEFVTMTNDEYASLIKKFGESDTKRLIEILDNYKGSTGKKYKSDYRAVLSWVTKRLEEDKAKEERQKAYAPGADKNYEVFSDNYNHDELEALTRKKR